MKILIFDTETGGVNCQMNDILQLSYQVIDSESQKSAKRGKPLLPMAREQASCAMGSNTGEWFD